MGGDHAPAEPVAGAVLAAKAGLDVVLVGDEPVLAPLLSQHDVDIDIVHAPNVIGMGDHPTRALRERPDSSIAVAARLVADGGAAGMVSAGSTGAAMAAAVFLIGRIPGVQRPPIATVIPAVPDPVVLLDSGANPDCKPDHLAQFAVIGSVLASTYHGVGRARVGLLNIGEEAGKGRDLERATWDLLDRLGRVDDEIEFVGNVEGRDVAGGKADVIVTDGYAGNLVLKTAEGAIRLVAVAALESLADFPEETQTAALPVLAALRERFDPDNTGGAHLLGTKGVVVIAHGSSSARAIERAIHVAAEGAEHDLVAKVTERIAADRLEA
jgi:glycerol-3-phosphate acyltransferase PlsX